MVLKNCAWGRDPALCGFCKCSNRLEAGGSKLEARLTVADFFKLRASSLLPQAYICLG
jgi:hypothetical protein